MAEEYDMYNDIEHVLERSDTYIGSIEVETEKRWIYNEDTKRMERKTVTYCPGLEQCFMEILTNATDRTQNIDNGVTKIKVVIEGNVISVTNNGKGIPIEIHPKHGIYVPEMIFGNMRTSSNYKKGVKRTVGGKNGIGAKAANIFSKWFKVTTVNNGEKYVQTFSNNMRDKTEPKISKVRGEDYTTIEYEPDLEKFGMVNLDDNDSITLLKKRVIDAAAVTNKKVEVTYNKVKVGVKNFEEYMNLYIGKKSETPRVFSEVSDRWSIGFALNPYASFTHISFVNGICTEDGGKHVDHVIDPVVNKVTKQLQDKNPDITIKKQYIKDNIIVFVKSLIENPTFNSQTKRFHTTQVQKFGSGVTINDDTIKKICKLGITQGILDIAKAKDNKALKKIDGKKKKSIKGIPKLDDANEAGGSESLKCTLILTEGDSAKATALAGLSVVGKDYYGVFPLKGKLLNVAKASDKTISDNEEIVNINQILGLAQGEQDKSKIRYGKIMIMCDQDVDGFHIKGLLFNYITKYWPDLFADDFIETLLTPIIKVFRNSQVKCFYNVEDYNKWKEETPGSGGWRVKYYKGLGTSTAKEAKEYFSNLAQNKIMYKFDSSVGSEDIKSIELAFHDIDNGKVKKSSDLRKDWITNSIKIINNHKKSNIPLVDYNEKVMKVSDFINKELVQFSIYDNERSISHVIDGLKPSQRKILYSCLKRNLFQEKNEIKVAQLSGYVSEKTNYHHGEASLQGAIVNMAQDYVGSNNMNILIPNGQFGCVDPNTPILMWDSSIKKAKDIVIGDKLIGDDGNVRIVSGLTSGIDEMYKISNGNMDDYIVNSNHILTLCCTIHKSIFWKESSKRWIMWYFDDNNKKILSKTTGINVTKEEGYYEIVKFSNNIDDNNIFDITVQQYLSLSESSKKYMKGIVNNSVIKWKEKEIEIDPYILGLWLGDGMSDCHAFASMDSEIIKSWAEWLDKIGCEICHCKNYPPHEAHTFYIRRRGSGNNIAIGDKLHSSENCKGCNTSKYKLEVCDWKFNKSSDFVSGEGFNKDGKNVVNMNPFRELFKKYKLYKNKHIPIEFIVNSEENRLKLLAGMIDSDGCLKHSKNTCYYSIYQCSKRYDLLESFRIVAGSLGFRAKIIKIKDKGFELNITGDVNKIPVKVERKKIKKEIKKLRNPFIHGISINSIGKGEFYGWNIDKNERFLLSDFTITHNTRNEGGKDSGGPRYIFTYLSDWVRTVFNSDDNKLLNYLDDDGTPIEPEFYVPVLPMILINGTCGMGTGWSTNVPCFNPKDIIENLKLLINDPESELYELTPWYRGFKGTITKIKDGNWECKGIYRRLKPTRIYQEVEVTELPVGVWTQSFKNKLSDYESKDKIVSFKNFSDHRNVKFIIKFKKDVLEELSDIKLDKMLGMTTKISTSNMHLFNSEGVIEKYDTPEDILWDFYEYRSEFYKIRKDNMEKELDKKLKYLMEMMRFIQMVIDEKILVFKRKKDDIVKDLEDNYFIKIDDTYNHLLGIKIHAFTREKLDELKKQIDDNTIELETLKSKTSNDLWIEDIDMLDFNKIMEIVD